MKCYEQQKIYNILHIEIRLKATVCLSCSTGYYSEGDFATPEGTPLRSPSFRLPPDPRAETAFGARPPPSRSDGAPLSLAPLPEGPYRETGEEEDEEEVPSWRQGPPFPPFTGRGRGGAGAGTGAGGRGGPPVFESEFINSCSCCHFLSHFGFQSTG